MKKITSIDPITFRVDGDTLLEITSEGCIATDSAAAFAKEKLGDHITVIDTTAEEVIDEARAALTVPQLKEKAKGYGLAVGGTKDDLTARIAEYEAANPPVSETGTVEQTGAEVATDSAAA